ncbi:hypothetical protein CRENBAI_000481, partial [Crenichthys baileyi]
MCPLKRWKTRTESHQRGHYVHLRQKLQAVIRTCSMWHPAQERNRRQGAATWRAGQSARLTCWYQQHTPSAELYRVGFWGFASVFSLLLRVGVEMTSEKPVTMPGSLSLSDRQPPPGHRQRGAAVPDTATGKPMMMSGSGSVVLSAGMINPAVPIRNIKMKFAVLIGLIQVGEVSNRDIVETVLNLGIFPWYKQPQCGKNTRTRTRRLPLIRNRVAGAADSAETPRRPSPPTSPPAPPGGAQGVPRPAERHSPSSVSWAVPWASSRWDEPGTPPEESVQEASGIDARATSTGSSRCGGAAAYSEPLPNGRAPHPITKG